MGYETKLIIGSKGDNRHPVVEDEDGNYRKDENGKFIYDTESTEAYISVMSMIDLCKIYNAKNLNTLHSLAEKSASEKNYVYFYDTDGNTKIKQDRYDKYLWAIPLKDVVKALRKDIKADEDNYRRFKWAYALLSSMLKTDKEEKFVIFFGH